MMVAIGVGGRMRGGGVETTVTATLIQLGANARQVTSSHASTATYFGLH